MPADRTQPPERDPELAPAAQALAHAYQRTLKRVSLDPAEGRLGISRPAYAKACVRNQMMIAQLCNELGEYWWRLAQYNAKATGSDWKRHAARMRDDAAVELLELVHRMSPPVRRVVELRALGTSWRDIARLLPDRAVWSMTDDWRSACRTLVERHDDLVKRIN